MISNKIHFIVQLLLLILVIPTLASAHKINLIAYEKDGVVFSESFYPDGKPVLDGKIIVSDSRGETLISGMTDLHGLFQFQKPVSSGLTVSVQTQMGHKASTSFGSEQLQSTPFFKPNLKINKASHISAWFSVFIVIFSFVGAKFIRTLYCRLRN